MSEAAMKGGDDLAVNGSFSADSDWTKGAGWTIGSGVATAAGAISTDLTATVAPLTSGDFYTVSFNITAYTTGTVVAKCGTVTGNSHGAVGSFTDVIKANGTAFAIDATSFTGSIDNVVVRELNQSTTDLADNSTITANNVYPTQGVRGNGQKWYSFDGVDDVVPIGAQTALNSATNFTLIFMAEKSVQGDVAQFGSWITSSNQANIEWFSDGRLYGLVRDSETSYTSVALAGSGRHVIGMTYDGTEATPADRVNLYVDGVLQASGMTGTVPASSSATAGNDFNINNEGSTYYNGSVSDGYVFNYTVPSDSITSWSTKIAEGTFHLPFEDQGADNVAGYTSDFSGASLDDWDATNSWGTQTNPSTYLHLIASAADQLCRRSVAFLEVGKSYRVEYTAANTVGTPEFAGYTGSAPITYVTIVDGSNSATFTHSSSAGTNYLYIASNANLDACDLSSIIVTELGSTLSLSPEGIYSTAWNDYYHLDSYAVSGPTREEYGKHTALRFNGSDSYLMKADADFDGTGGMVIAGWMNANSWGGGNLGRLFDATNSFRSYITDTQLLVLIRGGASASSSAVIELNKWVFFAMIAPSDGTGNVFWIGDKDTAPTDQTLDSTTGTPADGGDLYIGDVSGSGGAFNGTLDFNIWYLDQINMPIEEWVKLLWNSTK